MQSSVSWGLVFSIFCFQKQKQKVWRRSTIFLSKNDSRRELSIAAKNLRNSCLTKKTLVLQLKNLAFAILVASNCLKSYYWDDQPCLSQDMRVAAVINPSSQQVTKCASEAKPDRSEVLR